MIQHLDEHFTELCEFIKEARFDRFGAFTFSPEDGTPAADFPNQVADAEKEHPDEIIMEQQDVRVGDYCNSRIGAETEAVVEGYDRYSEMFFGRDASYAPEIDGMMYFTSEKKLALGEFVKVKITDNLDNNLLGEVIS